MKEKTPIKRQKEIRAGKEKGDLKERVSKKKKKEEKSKKKKEKRQKKNKNGLTLSGKK